MAVAISTIARCESGRDILHCIDSHFFRDLANLLERPKTDPMVGLSPSVAMGRARLLAGYHLRLRLLGRPTLETRLCDE